MYQFIFNYTIDPSIQLVTQTCQANLPVSPVPSWECSSSFYSKMDKKIIFFCQKFVIHLVVV